MKEALERLVAEMVEKGILFEEARSEFERRFIAQVLERTQGNRTAAAQALGMHRNTLRRKLRELQLEGKGAGKIRAAATKSARA